MRRSVHRRRGHIRLTDGRLAALLTACSGNVPAHTPDGRQLGMRGVRRCAEASDRSASAGNSLSAQAGAQLRCPEQGQRSDSLQCPAVRLDKAAASQRDWPVLKCAYYLCEPRRREAVHIRRTGAS